MILTWLPSWMLLSLQERHNLSKLTQLDIETRISDFYEVTLHFGQHTVIEVLRCPSAEDKDRKDHVKQFSQADMDAATKPLHVEIERLTNLLKYKKAGEQLDARDRKAKRFK